MIWISFGSLPKNQNPLCSLWCSLNPRFFLPLDELHFKLVIHERFYLKSVHSLANKTFKFFLTFLESALFICLFCVKSWTTKMLRKIHNNPLKLTLKNRVKTKVIFQIRGTHPPCEKMQKKCYHMQILHLFSHLWIYQFKLFFWQNRFLPYCVVKV